MIRLSLKIVSVLFLSAVCLLGQQPNSPTASLEVSDNILNPLVAVMQGTPDEPCLLLGSTGNIFYGAWSGCPGFLDIPFWNGLFIIYEGLIDSSGRQEVYIPFVPGLTFCLQAIIGDPIFSSCTWTLTQAVEVQF